ncbi:MAG: endolytic transglycosylase MltG [Thermoanaerobaculia bacterium]|nr:endolytic transglycosylase MltG [Thermoanaerobaculia bacterium]
MIRKIFFTILVLGLVALGAATAVGWHLWQQFHQPFRAWVGAEQIVNVAPGTSAPRILADLERAGVLRDARLARYFLIYRLGDPPLLAGEYRFRQEMAAPDVLAKLIRGEVTTYPVTLIEGLDLHETAEALTRQGFGDVNVFLREMRDPSRISDLDPLAEDLEGYLYPETYHFSRGTPESDIVDLMVGTFRQGWSDEVAPLLERRAELEDLGLDEVPEEGLVRAVVSLASIVEKETQKDDERNLVASVYTNRLRIGMPLQADPTVIAALKREGRWDGNIRRPDLQMDHPYNTYVRGGLPPGPICSPTLDSLLAVLQPADTKYLYFVSRNDGTHAFAASLAEHNRNVYRWQKLYWREKWAKERNGK